MQVLIRHHRKRKFLYIFVVLCLLFSLYMTFLLLSTDKGHNLMGGGADIQFKDPFLHPKDTLTALKGRKGGNIALPLVDIQQSIQDNSESKQHAARQNLTDDRNNNPIQNNEMEEHILAKQEKKHIKLSSYIKPNYNVHIFYYPWYGNLKDDGDYFHWNHAYIQHWKPEEALKWPSGKHNPPDDLGSSYYPQLGPYSSSDKEVVEKHMEMILSAGIGVVVVSWYPPGDADQEGKDPDSLMPLILDSAHKFGLEVAVHIEPYKNRDPTTMRENMKYLFQSYGNHPAFYRKDHNGHQLPVVYIYDSYHTPSSDWAQLLKPDGKMSVRNTELDALFIGLLVEFNHQKELLDGGFDGFYSYFAANGFTYGSSWHRWKEINSFAKLHNLLFIPSVGPGYIDTEVRPWNGANTRKRLEGNYYRDAFQNAVSLKPEILSITSFNEWHEGTQIEPAITKTIPKRNYLDYGKNGPDFYLKITKEWVDKFTSLSI
ncbi:hypothetical protein ACJMK2_028208 [Sinanodonta woodiana]|uniref:Glycoprotein endo-alpha-1,2-mannosidase n=1 Tax=Sinanodonta woodiana TaxID=1069815 RepID=A0ABD3X898_SINWO